MVPFVQLCAILVQPLVPCATPGPCTICPLVLAHKLIEPLLLQLSPLGGGTQSAVPANDDLVDKVGAILEHVHE